MLALAGGFTCLLLLTGEAWTFGALSGLLVLCCVPSRICLVVWKGFFHVEGLHRRSWYGRQRQKSWRSQWLQRRSSTRYSRGSNRDSFQVRNPNSAVRYRRQRHPAEHRVEAKQDLGQDHVFQRTMILFGEHAWERHLQQTVDVAISVETMCVPLCMLDATAPEVLHHIADVVQEIPVAPLILSFLLSLIPHR